jgi:hypothetical protein
MPDSKATIDALCDILGDECDDEEAKRQAEEEEADRLRAERAAAIEAEKSRKGERLKAFRAVSTSTLRLQQLQMVFLDLPILPTPLHDFFLGSDAEAAKSEKSATIADLPDVDWFDVTLPSDDSILGAKTTDAVGIEVSKVGIRCKHEGCERGRLSPRVRRVAHRRRRPHPGVPTRPVTG